MRNSVHKILFFVVFWSVDTGEGAIFAQSTGTFSIFAPQLVPTNPAVAGWLGVPSLTLTARQQWMGFEGAPSTQVLSFQSPLLGKRLGIGASVENDMMGIQSAQTATFGLSYAVVKAQHFGFRMGLHGVGRRWRYNFEAVQNLPDVDDPALSGLTAADKMVFNVGAGALLYYRHSWLGVSVPFAIENEYGFAPQTPLTSQEMRILQVTGGLVFPVSENLMLKNAFCWKLTNSLMPWSIEMNGNFVWQERIGFGLGYRASRNSLEKIGESMSILASYVATDKLTIFVGYDLPANKMSPYHAGSAEIAIRYDLKVLPVDLSNPRFR